MRSGNECAAAADLFGAHLRTVILGVLTIVGGTVSYFVSTYMTSYAIATLHLPASAALVLALLLVWVSVRMWNPSARLPVRGTNNGEALSLMDEFPSSLFLLNEAIIGDLGTGSARSYNLAAAVLEADRPCEWYYLPAIGVTESSIEDSGISETTPFATGMEVNPVARTVKPKA